MSEENNNWKDTNPKDAVGCTKLPLHLFPMTATALGALALLDGMLKYGRANWREIGVKSSIYMSACMRHLIAWFEGEENDPDSGLPHLGHAIACLAILIDAQAAGKLNDDRNYPAEWRKFINEMTPHVKRLLELHKDKSPKHWTIGDTVKEDNSNKVISLGNRFVFGEYVKVQTDNNKEFSVYPVVIDNGGSTVALDDGNWEPGGYYREFLSRYQFQKGDMVYCIDPAKARVDATGKTYSTELFTSKNKAGIITGICSRGARMQLEGLSDDYNPEVFRKIE